MAVRQQGKREPVMFAVKRTAEDAPRILTIRIDRNDPDDRGASIVRSWHAKVARGRLHSVVELTAEQVQAEETAAKERAVEAEAAPKKATAKKATAAEA